MGRDSLLTFSQNNGKVLIMSDWETERVTEVWNNRTGEHYAVGQDRDGLGLVEIRSYSAASEKALERISMPVEVAVQVAQAILREYSEVPRIFGGSD